MSNVNLNELESFKTKLSQDRQKILAEIEQLKKQDESIANRLGVLHANLNATIGGLNTIEQLIRKAQEPNEDPGRPSESETKAKILPMKSGTSGPLIERKK